MPKAEFEFDVFLSYRAADRPVVEELAQALKKRGIKPWLDKWRLAGGAHFQEEIGKALKGCAACAVLKGRGEIGRWQSLEIDAAIQREREGKGGPVIPVLLPNSEWGELPEFLTGLTRIEFHDTIEDDEALRALICGIRGEAPGPDPETAQAEMAKTLPESACPFRGLQVFDVEHTRFFHGRTALIARLLAKLQPNGLDLRFLAITGGSGSGKSSLARAGLLASLKSGALPGSGDWPLAVCQPGPDPLESLARAFVDALPAQGPESRPGIALDLKQDLGRDDGALHVYSHYALDGAPERRLVMLIDQFEEVFTLCADKGKRKAFIGNLLHAARAVKGRTAVVLTLRDDDYGRCADDPDLCRAVSDRGELVRRMNRDELRSVIEEPARQAGLVLEGDLADRLLDDMEREPGGLPLLQHALLQLWQKREGNRLTAAAYRAIGGVAGALQRHAEEIFTGFDEPRQEACRRILLRLVQVDETGATRRRLDYDEVVSAAERGADREAAAAVVDELAAQRLLTVEAKDEEKKCLTVDLAHEALIDAWKRLRQWIEDDREGLRTRRRLEETASEWSGGGGDPSYLYTGVRLTVAEEWAAKHPDELLRPSQELLAASVTRRDEEIETRRRQRRRGIVALASAAAVAALMAVGMYRLWRTAEQHRQAAERQRQVNLSTLLAERARLALASNPLTSLLLAADAVRRDGELPRATGALLGALALSDADRLGGPGIVAVAASSDRRSLVSVGQEGVATLWKLEPGSLPAPGRTFRVQGPVAALALSNDRRWLLARDPYGDVRRLDLKMEQEVALPDQDWRTGDPFSSDSRWLTMDQLGQPVRYDLLRGAVQEMPGAGAASASPREPDATAASLAMAPPGARIAALSSGGRWLAWGEESGAVHLRERAFPGLPPIELPGQGQRVGFLMFAPGDHWLVTQSGTEALRLWDLDQFPRGGILAATPDGSRCVVGRPSAASPDRSAASVPCKGPGVAWPLQGIEPGAAWAISPDGSCLAAGQGGRLFLWQLGGGAPRPRSIAGVAPMPALAFSSEGDRLAIGGEGTCELWDLASGGRWVLTRDPGKEQVTAVAFSPSRHRLATGWSGGMVRIYRLDDPDLAPHEAVKLDAAVTALAFSRDGEWLAMTAANGKARLWKDGPRKALDDQDHKVRVLAFSPDGRWLAGGGNEGSLQLWDLGDPSGEPVAWQGHTGPVHSLSFARDARQLITTGQSVRTWPLAAGELKRLACEKAGRNLTSEEWGRFAPEGEGFREGTPCGVR